MSSFQLIRSQVEQRVPGGLCSYERVPGPTLPSGIPALDQYGIRAGTLTQICSSSEASSGKTSILVSLLSQVTRTGAFCALVDATDCFDPVGAQRAGVRLDHLLWVRCASKGSSQKKHRLNPLEQAFKATDILIQNGGFRVIGVDLGEIGAESLRKVPLTTWFRFSRVVEKTETALLFLTPYPAAASCAALSLNARTVETCWANADCGHMKLLSVTTHEFDLVRQRLRKPAQSAKPHFSATPQWA
jgi:hypothetical protein